MIGIAGWTSIHWLHRLRQPTRSFSGTDDPIVPLINAKIMARSGAAFQRVQFACHMTLGRIH
jgi:hypothetical protein